MNDVSKKWYSKKEKEKEKEINITTEMCDVCGKDCEAPIPRSKYLTKSGIKFIIRHHKECNPFLFGQLFLER